MKHLLSLLFAVTLLITGSSCSVGPTELADGRVTLGGSFLAEADADSRQVTKKDGTTLSWVRAKPNETSVAKYAISGYATVKSLDSAYKTVKSNNDAATAQQAATLNAQTQQQQIAATQATDAAKLANQAAAKAGTQANVGKLIDNGSLKSLPAKTVTTPVAPTTP